MRRFTKRGSRASEKSLAINGGLACLGLILALLFLVGNSYGFKVKEYCIEIAFPPESAIPDINRAAPPIMNLERRVNAIGDVNFIFDGDSVYYFKFMIPECGTGLNDMFLDSMFLNSVLNAKRTRIPYKDIPAFLHSYDVRWRQPFITIAFSDKTKFQKYIDVISLFNKLSIYRYVQRDFMPEESFKSMAN